MKLHLVRHGKAEKFSKSGKDYDRKLTDKGIMQAKRLGEHLSIKGLQKNNIVYCSSAQRTNETLNELLISVDFKNVVFKDEFYLCSKETLLDFIWSLEHDEDLFIVGHNFGISDLGQYFTDEFIELKTGEYLCIVFDTNTWKETSLGTGAISDRYRASADL